MNKLCYVDGSGTVVYYPLPFEEDYEAMQRICDVINAEHCRLEPTDIGYFSICSDIPVSVKPGVFVNLMQLQGTE